MTFKLFTVNNFKKLKINLNKKLNIILKYFSTEETINVKINTAYQF